MSDMQSRPSQVLGHIVRELREMAVRGASPLDMHLFLEARASDGHARMRYMSAAFLQREMEFWVTMTNRSGSEYLKDRILELIQRRRDTWERQRFPELMRLHDYFAFSRFAMEQRLLVFVCAANRHAGQYIGRPGFECYEGTSFVMSHESG